MLKKEQRKLHLIKGKQSENLVLNQLIKQNWRVISKNTKYSGIEIDLIAQKKERTVIFEIKSLSQECHLDKILSLKQKKRLQLAAKILSEDFPNGLELILATVNNKKVSFFSIDF